MENGNEKEGGDRIERDAKDIVEAGKELENARERELKASAGEASIDAAITELQLKKTQFTQDEKDARRTQAEEEKRISDDVEDIRNVNGHNGGGNNPEPDNKNVTIVINTADFATPRGKITYERVVAVAYPDFTSYPNATYSIMYERGPRDNPQGVLSKGGAVEVTEGMRFRVKRTGES